MTKTRSDVHCPSKMKTNDYVLLGYIYIGSDPFLIMEFAWEAQMIRESMTRLGLKYSHHDHAGTCGVCGANALYLGVFHHLPTNTVIEAGKECAHKIDMQDDEGFTAMYRRANAARERQQKLEAARIWSKENGIPCMECVSKSHYIVSSLWTNLQKYGCLSERQVALAKKIINEVKTPKVEEVQPTKNAPSGRILFSGEVLCVKEQETDFGYTLKMLARSDDGGWKIWCSVPSNLCNIGRGTKIEMNVTVTPSDRDGFFGFGKRPAKAKVIGD